MAGLIGGSSSPRKCLNNFVRDGNLVSQCIHVSRSGDFAATAASLGSDGALSVFPCTALQRAPSQLNIGQLHSRAIATLKSQPW
jgi:hypothetical protein